ncbi:PQQ-binding-like beta-propeller repeat protein [Candidatus Pelagibacter sp.]|nr:PQQ-binding-like beta-propeller repeat protein [Candidatus Pelagibacter sp.]
MNKFWFLILLVLANCSFDTKTGIWTDSKPLAKEKNNSIEIFKKKKSFQKELNSSVKLELDLENLNKVKSDINTNNNGVIKKKISIKEISKFKFKKIDYFNHFEPDLVFDNENYVFFDDKSNILKFDKKFKLVWKKNFYTKKERKLNPILTLALNNGDLIVTDTIGKIYKINFLTGNLIWEKNNTFPFNSELKIYENRAYVIDINNTLRCFSLENGKELWKFDSENTFLKSNKRNSIVLKNDVVFFNNSMGDVVAVDAINGSLIWLTPTQNSSIYENAFSLKLSDLVIDNGDLLFSTNKNEFYSINLSNGIVNWKQNINSSVRPIILGNLIFTISNEGYLFIIQKLSGNIIKVNDIFKNFKKTKRNQINPVGFIISSDKIIVSNDNGKLLVVNLKTGQIESILKIDNEKISRPFVFDNQLVLVKDNAIIRLN